MSGSLQDQLLKAGLVTEEQLETARAKPARPPGGGRGKAPGGGRGKGRGKPGGGKRRGPGDGGERGDNAARADRRPAQGKGRGKGDGKRSGQNRPGRGKGAGKAKTPQPELSPEERALRDRVHAMINESAEKRDEGETAFHFVKGSRIKRIYVTAAQRDRLASDELAVAAMKGKHYLVPRTVADEIKALIPGYFIAMGSAEADTSAAESVDDEYAEFQVPDDLTW